MCLQYQMNMYLDKVISTLLAALCAAGQLRYELEPRAMNGKKIMVALEFPNHP